MAIHYSKGGGQPLPIALIGQAIPMLTRHELEAVTERLLEALDALDAPTEDLEPEEDCCGAHEDRGSAFRSADYIAHGQSYNDDDEPRLVPITLN